MYVCRAWTDWGWGGCRGGQSPEQTLPSMPLPVVRVTDSVHPSSPSPLLQTRLTSFPLPCLYWGRLLLPGGPFSFLVAHLTPAHLLSAPSSTKSAPLACTPAPPGTLVLARDITQHSAIWAQAVMLIEFCAAQSISDKQRDYPQSRHPNKSNRSHIYGLFHPWPVQVCGSPGLRLPGGLPSSTPGPAPLRVQAVCVRVKREAALRNRKSRVQPG